VQTEIVKKILSNDESGVEKYHVSEEIGYGIRATTTYERGDFIVAYHGELLHSAELIQQRDEAYDKEGRGSYMLHFLHNGERYW
jgi:hypothetical protein